MPQTEDYEKHIFIESGASDVNQFDYRGVSDLIR
jgi:hypothetical protein